ncbi:hypothetical protein [Enterobacter asburiae]|uniref:hypothetical protein n=1 Tax=Enterobacter asburiae TaxID=61645 RepID=UPI001CC770D1|nr:hypothetical protein [Enterobacter asburiae]BCP71365.1 hypothetical protein R1N_35520 [Enterobacter asburiae]HDV8910954.1 hypothetical protein [Enterobacter asburiae]HDX4633052.1 hypothetical protein [Enterobacter asburiae]HDX4675683.1 hypothetical protein [Enterobacter asburiae]
MKTLAAVGDGFRFKGVWWTEATFTDELKLVLSLHRAMSNHRIAFHFGVSEKAVRKLRARSSAANGVINCLMEEAKLSKDRPARYRERNWYNNYPDDIEARKILIAAEAERERQRVVRHEQRKQRTCRATDGVARLERMRAQRREAVQHCKRSGLTQVLAAESLSCSVRTVRRYW